MEVLFYQNFSDKHVAHKKTLFMYGTNAQLVTPCDVLEPVFTVNYHEKILSSNYCYIPLYSRYYFCTITHETHNTFTISCTVDALSSWINHILNITALINRQEFVYSPYIQDDELLTKCDRLISKKKIGSIGSPSGSYIALTVTGGNS